MTRMIYDTDPNGMKLFGKCKYVGECRCGGCDLAPANQQNEVTVTQTDGSQKKITAPAVHPDEYETGTSGFNHEPQLAAKTGQSDKPIPPKAYKLPDPVVVDGRERPQMSARSAAQLRPKKPVIADAAQMSSCGYCKKRRGPCVRHGGERSGVYTPKKKAFMDSTRRNGPVVIHHIPPVQESANPGNLDKPLAEPENEPSAADSQISVNEPIPAKDASMTYVENGHEVTIQLGSIMITIRPVVA